LSSADRGASTARFKFVGSVEALEIGGETTRAGDGACGETHGAELRLASRGLTLPGMSAGGAGRRWGWLLATHLVVGPFPLVVALGGGRETRAGLVGNAAVVFLAPGPFRVRAFFLTWG